MHPSEVSRHPLTDLRTLSESHLPLRVEGPVAPNRVAPENSCKQGKHCRPFGNPKASEACEVLLHTIMEDKIRSLADETDPDRHEQQKMFN